MGKRFLRNSMAVLAGLSMLTTNLGICTLQAPISVMAEEAIPTKTYPFEIIWDDNNNQDGLRPNQVTFTFTGNGKTIPVVLSVENEWKTSVDIPTKTASGQAISYNLKSSTVSGYNPQDISSDGVERYIYKLSPSIVTYMKGTMAWNDRNNTKNTRPDELPVYLKANGKVVETQIANGKNNWSFNFTNKPNMEHGEKIIYTVETPTIPGYSTAITGHKVRHDLMSSLRHITVHEYWDDDNNRDGIRPTDSTVYLYANGEDTGQSVSLDASNRWTGFFEDLDVNDENGNPIRYTLRKDKMDSYSAKVSVNENGTWVITNSHNPDTVSFGVLVQFVNADSASASIPESVRVTAYGNSELAGADTTASRTVNEDSSWYTSYTVKKNEAKKSAEWYVKAPNLSGFEKTITGSMKDGYLITYNAKEGEKTPDTAVPEPDPEPGKEEPDNPYEGGDIPDKNPDNPGPENPDTPDNPEEPQPILKTIIVRFETNDGSTIEGIEIKESGRKKTYTVAQNSVALAPLDFSKAYGDTLVIPSVTGYNGLGNVSLRIQDGQLSANSTTNPDVRVEGETVIIPVTAKEEWKRYLHLESMAPEKTDDGFIVSYKLTTDKAMNLTLDASSKYSSIEGSVELTDADGNPIELTSQNSFEAEEGGAYIARYKVKETSLTPQQASKESLNLTVAKDNFELLASKPQYYLRDLGLADFAVMEAKEASLVETEKGHFVISTTLKNSGTKKGEASLKINGLSESSDIQITKKDGSVYPETDYSIVQQDNTKIIKFNLEPEAEVPVQVHVEIGDEVNSLKKTSILRLSLPGIENPVSLSLFDAHQNYIAGLMGDIEIPKGDDNNTGNNSGSNAGNNTNKPEDKTEDNNGDNAGKADDLWNSILNPGTTDNTNPSPKPTVPSVQNPSGMSGTNPEEKENRQEPVEESSDVTNAPGFMQTGPLTSRKSPNTGVEHWLLSGTAVLIAAAIGVFAYLRKEKE